MSIEDSIRFKNALKENDLNAIRKIPKSDLHNHLVLGGNREYIFEKTGIKIEPMNGIISSMEEMHKWGKKYISRKFDNRKMHKILLESAFYQAKIDGIKLLEIGEDVWANEHFYNDDISALIDTFQSAKNNIAPDIDLRFQIGISRHCDVDLLAKWLMPFWKRKEFYSIDLSGDEMAQPIEKFIPIYEKAKKNGLVLKAHIGEWGEADDIINGVEALQLDEVQHGISAAYSSKVINYLIEKHIRLNICPTSNIKLGRVKSYEEHPIKKLYLSGIDVTINSDDVLIFDSDVSKEYLRLYQSNALTAEQLDDIRINGLKLL